MSEEWCSSPDAGTLVGVTPLIACVPSLALLACCLSESEVSYVCGVTATFAFFLACPGASTLAVSFHLHSLCAASATCEMQQCTAAQDCSVNAACMEPSSAKSSLRPPSPSHENPKGQFLLLCFLHTRSPLHPSLPLSLPSKQEWWRYRCIPPPPPTSLRTSPSCAASRPTARPRSSSPRGSTSLVWCAPPPSSCTAGRRSGGDGGQPTTCR